MNGYQTRQRQLILDFLQKNGDRHVSAREITQSLSRESVGQTTVYRYLDRLSQEGAVHKYSAPDGSGTCYQYAGEDGVCHRHYHLKCRRCGTLIHLECDKLDEIAAHINREHRFRIDPFQTVFYGVCEHCAGQEDTPCS